MKCCRGSESLFFRAAGKLFKVPYRLAGYDPLLAEKFSIWLDRYRGGRLETMGGSVRN